MEPIKKLIFITALFITLFMVTSVVLVGLVMGDARESKINEMSAELIQNLNEMQTFTLMAETYGDEMACLAYKSKLQELDRSVWDLGMKIDQYRVASEEFQTDPFYVSEKEKFNENEVMYMMLLRKIQDSCAYNQSVISFFYRKSEECSKCDDQSFVLTDLKKMAPKELSIFSYDVDLNLSTVNLLKEYYEVDQYPCVIIDDVKYCGIQDKGFIVGKLCESYPLSICQG